MRLEQQTRDTTIMAQESGKFTIANNAKTFQILIDNLYSDKPKSITQEIWSNAFDSHRDAGKDDLPFDVTLPSVWSPSFRVRDFGVGLSHEDVMGLYTTVGASTKENSNVGVGKWGLGSKIPFAYTDTFTVTSWFNGTVRYYTAMKDNEGIPTINLMGSESTSEANGLEVAFPVKDQDFSTFKKAAERVSMGFTVKPTVDGQPYSWPDFKVSHEKDNWKVIDTASLPYDSPWKRTAWAKMGCVIYPIRGDRLSANTEITNYPVIVEFDIGAIDVTASREDISYDPTTIKNIEDALWPIGESLLEEVYKRIDSEKNDWKRRRLIATERGMVPHFLKERFSKKYGRYDTIEIPSASLNDLTFMSGVSTYNLSYRKKLAPFRSETTYSKTYDFNVGKYTIFVERTTKGNRDVRGSQRIYEYLIQCQANSKDYGTVIWIRMDEDVKEELDAFNTLINTIEEEVVFVDDIPDPGPANKGVSRPVFVKEHRNYGNYDIELSSAEMDAGGVYVTMERGSYTRPDDIRKGVATWGEHKDIEVAQVLRKHDRIIVVPKTHWKKFVDHDKWQHIVEYGEEWYKKHENQITAALLFDDTSDNVVMKLTNVKDKLILEYRNRTPPTVDGLKVSDLRSLISTMNKPAQANNKVSLLTRIRQRYPLLSQLSPYNLKYSDVEEYVNLLHKEKKYD